MSNPLAIATVTQTLRNILQDSLGPSNVTGAQVTFFRPDDATHLPNPGVNVFLYQIAPNTALRNADLPTRASDGTLLQRPQAAVDLFYLITFYGDDAKLEQQRLLGAVTLALHAQPWLPGADITTAEGATYLAGSDLSAQTDRVRFRPVSFSLEELSKLWSFLLKTDYVLSAAYVASVVLLDTADVAPPPALPVLTSNLLLLAAAPPAITAVAAVGGGVILPGAVVTITGTNLLGPTGTLTIVTVGGATLTPSTASATQLNVTLPATLSAGWQALVVAQQPLLGVPPVAHAGGTQSPPFPVTLAPLIRRTGIPPVYQVTVQTGVGTPPADQVTVTLDPPIAIGQRVLLSLLPTAAGALPSLFDGGTVSAATNAPVFTVGTPPAGSYLVQVIVDSAESPLDLDAGGNPAGPKITF